MAFITGTSANAADAYSKLLAFLTANADLLAAGENWSTAWTHPSGDPREGIILRGPGLSGDQSILVGMRLVEEPINDQYWIELRGLSGVIPTGLTWVDHVNVSPTYVRMFLDDAPMTHWFVANGRRFVVVMKISTVFEAMYAGLILPYATPLRYPYPLFIGGSAGERWNTSVVDSWRSTDRNHRQFPFSSFTSGTNNPTTVAAQMLSPAGEWLDVVGDAAQDNSGDVIIHPNARMPMFLPNPQGDSAYQGNGGFGSTEVHAQLRATKDGLLPMTHMHLVRRTGQEAIYGVFDGCERIVGIGNSSENMAVVDGVSYLTVQDTYRTGTGDYWALKLE